MSICSKARVNVDAAAWGKDYESKNRGQQFSGTVVARKSNGDLLVETDDEDADRRLEPHRGAALAHAGQGRSGLEPLNLVE